MGVIRKLRLHLEQRDGTLRRAGQLVFTARDASLYVVPYVVHDEYVYGQTHWAPEEQSKNINLRSGTRATGRPKLSIHENGQVHVHAGDGSTVAGPVFIRALREFRGEQLAAVQWDAISELPKYEGRLKTSGEERDVAFGVPAEVKAGILRIYANGERNAFLTDHVHFAVEVDANSTPTIFYGISAVAHDKLSGPAGVTVLAPVDVRLNVPGDTGSFLFLRGT
jgi:hypothetical protein